MFGVKTPGDTAVGIQAMAYQAPTHPPAKLTLHLEADTLPELMDLMDQAMGSFAPDRISAIRHDTTKPAVELDIHATKEAADAAATEAKPKAKRAKKEDQPEEAEAPTINAMKTLAPNEARDKGIEMVTQFFAADPAHLGQIQTLSTKYGVKHFKDVPDDKAATFYADVIAMANGTASA